MQICLSAIKIDSYFNLTDSYLVYPILVVGSPQTHFPSMRDYKRMYIFAVVFVLKLRQYYFFCLERSFLNQNALP